METSKTDKLLLAGVIASVILASACLFWNLSNQVFDREEIEYSKPLHAIAQVIRRNHTPAKTTTGTKIQGIPTDKGLRFIPLPTVETIPDGYSIIFKHKRGETTLAGNTEQVKKLWEKLRKGDSVRITYKEAFVSRYRYRGSFSNISSRKRLERVRSRPLDMVLLVDDTPLSSLRPQQKSFGFFLFPNSMIYRLHFRSDFRLHIGNSSGILL